MMLKPTSNYKMSKQTKTFLAQLWNHPLRGQIRRAMINAELASKVVIKSKKDRSN